MVEVASIVRVRMWIVEKGVVFPESYSCQMYQRLPHSSSLFLDAVKQQ